MQKLIGILKSRGKIGGWLLILLGVGMFVAIGFGKMAATPENYALATSAFGMGLTGIGIRGKLDKVDPKK